MAEILKHLLSDLLTLKTESGIEPVDTPEKWRRKRLQIKETILSIIGAFPAGCPPLEMETLAQSEKENYHLRKVEYSVAPDERVRAYLLIPKQLTEPASAVLCLHGTSREAKEGQIGLGGNPDCAHALHLVARGYVTLAPDHLCSGERLPAGYEPYDTASFYERHPNWSAVGKSIWDCQRAIDYLISLDCVDAERVGCIGHSLGGHGAMFAAAFDERLKASVSNCGLTTFAKNPKRLAWARDHWYIYIPKLRAIFLNDEEAPFDIHEVVSLIAPRAFLNLSGLNDGTFANTDALAELGLRVNKVYRLLGAEEHFACYLHGSAHSFLSDSRALAYAWLDRWLNGSGKAESERSE